MLAKGGFHKKGVAPLLSRGQPRRFIRRRVLARDGQGELFEGHYAGVIQ
jgi:hypothetical protein